MYCDECKERPATVHLTKIVNNKKAEINLCEECAQSYQHLGGIEPNFSIHKFLTSLLDYENSQKMMGRQQRSDVRCKECGALYSEFSQSGKLGCSECYKNFSKGLKPLLKKIHGRTVHHGKVPVKSGGKIRIKRDIEKLRNDLKTLIINEEFEKAAQVRDKIRELEKKLD